MIGKPRPNLQPEGLFLNQRICQACGNRRMPKGKPAETPKKSFFKPNITQQKVGFNQEK
jgi:hypothetical protein